MKHIILLLLINFSCNVNPQNVSSNILDNILGGAQLSTAALSNVLSSVLSEISEINDTVCLNQLQAFVNGIGDGEKWALEMFDASAKPQAGILMGNIMHVGNYDECLKINVKLSTEENVQGEYCTGIMTPHKKYGEGLEQYLNKSNIPLFDTKEEDSNLLIEAIKSYGFCVPAACSASTLEQIFDIIEEKLQSPINFTFSHDFCYSNENTIFSTSEIITIFVFAFFAFIILASTIYDIYVQQTQIYSHEESIWVSFSLYSNAKRLFSMKSTQNQFGCLNGLRVISMMWIVLCHGFMYSLYTPKINSLALIEWRDQLGNIFIPAGELSVDTFFTIGGLLVCYLFLKHNRKGIKFNLPMYYIHRILRLTPALGMIVLFTAVLFKYTGNGPFWPIVYETFQKTCEESWWTTLLYVQNIVHRDNQCMGQGWYLAVDTQMYFVSPLILFPLLKWPKRTIGAIWLYVVLESAYVFDISLTKDFTVNIIGVSSPDRYNLIYSPTYIRGTAYLIGMVAGYYIFKTEHRKIQLSKLMVVTLWILALGTLLTNCLVCYPLVVSCEEACVLKQAVYNGISRNTWSIAISMICFLCINKYGGLINTFLSSNIFTVLIRLNYNVYLLHLNVMIFKVARERTPTYFSNLNNYHSFFGDYAFTVAAAFLWTLAFEYPVIALEKFIFKKRPNKSTSAENGFSGGVQEEIIVRNGQV